MQPPKPRILIECTPTYGTNLLTGIQRVVRSVVSSTQNITSVEIVPVIIQDSRCYALPKNAFNVQHSSGFVSSVLRWLSFISGTPFVVKCKDWLRASFSGLFVVLRRFYLTSRLKMRSSSVALEPINFTASDMLLLLDSPFGRDEVTSVLSEAKTQKVAIVFVLYDLIPLLHSEYCEALKTKDFYEFVSCHLLRADGVIAISESVKNELLSFQKECFPTLTQIPKLDYFHLGVDRKNMSSTGQVRAQVSQLFEKGTKTFLMVSTIEPRKNHAYLLDAFDTLWQSGNSVQLVFIGRVGWDVQVLIDRIYRHPQLGKQFFVFNDANDAELVYCYEHATALVFPSFAEGFGLPIIEALEHQLPVIVSDIPVHHEVAGELAMYIDPHNPADLVIQVQQVLTSGVASQYMPVNYRWMTWQAATDQLIEKLLIMFHDIKSSR